MAYALGRRVEYYDQPTIRAIVKKAAQNGNRFSSFVLGIVNSAAFQMAQAEPAVTDCGPEFELSGGRATWSFITKKHLSRRTVLKGMGVTVALPVLDAMVPAGDGVVARRRPRRPPRRCGSSAMEMVHGAAGSTAFGAKKNLWAPEKVGPRVRPVARPA